MWSLQSHNVLLVIGGFNLASDYNWSIELKVPYFNDTTCSLNTACTEQDFEHSAKGICNARIDVKDRERTDSTKWHSFDVPSGGYKVNDFLRTTAPPLMLFNSRPVAEIFMSVTGSYHV